MLDQFRAHGLASRVPPFVSTQSSTKEWRSRGRMRVLIADDHRLIIEGVKTKLEVLDNDLEFAQAMPVASLHAQLNATTLPAVPVIAHRKSVGWGKTWAIGADGGGRRILKKKKYANIQ